MTDGATVATRATAWTNHNEAARTNQNAAARTNQNAAARTNQNAARSGYELFQLEVIVL
jgi:hypothetical protein